MLLGIIICGCNSPIDCELVIDNYSVDETKELSTDMFLQEFKIDSKSKRFHLKCLVGSKGEDISPLFTIDSLGSIYSFKLKKQYVNRFDARDSIFCFFWDDRKHIRSYAAHNLVKVNIKDNLTPCDSIKEIIYTSISEKLERLANDKDQLVDLYDKVLEGKIRDYLKSLNPIQKRRINECKRSFRLLDWVENSKKYGFAEKEYRLTPEIKSFLDVIIGFFDEQINSESWKYKNFSINIIGYADQQNFGDEVLISENNFGFNIDNMPPVLTGQNCNSPDSYISIDANNHSKKEIGSIKNNCELSWVRAFSAAQYVKRQFEQMSKSFGVDINYIGGNVSYGSDHRVNRKIEVKFELKAADWLQVAKQHSDFLNILPHTTDEEKRLFELLKKSYIEARYSKSFTVEKSELDYQNKRVQLLKELTELICKEKIEELIELYFA